jgi:hypothetical protein
LPAESRTHFPTRRTAGAGSSADFGVEVLLVGVEHLIRKEYDRLAAGPARATIVDAPEAIGMGEGLLSFRMSELVVRYAGEYLERDERDKAAALVKAAALTEGVVSVLAFLVVVLSAGLATRYFAKTPGTEKLFIFYALGLLANFNAETSTGILQGEVLATSPGE